MPTLNFFLPSEHKKSAFHKEIIRKRAEKVYIFSMLSFKTTKDDLFISIIKPKSLWMALSGESAQIKTI